MTMRDLSPPSVPEGLFPDGFETAVLRIQPGFPLQPDEAEAVHGAIDLRRNEFATGRACIRRALLSLGCECHSVPAGEDRAPRWPAGVIGSVSHSRTVAVAVVAWRQDARSVGIDVEKVGSLEPGLWPLIIRPDEFVPGEARGMPETLLFSCKEAAFKCWYQAGGGRIIEFLDVRLEIGPHVFTAILPPPGPARISGRWARSDDHWWSSAWLA